MKKILLAVLVLAAACGSAFAQNTNNAQQPQAAACELNGQKPGMCNPFEGLNLTADQQSKLDALKAECKARFEKSKADRQKEKADKKADKMKAKAEARAKATEIYAERTAEAKIAAAALIEAAEKDAIDRINHIKSTAALESRKLILAAKRDVINEVLDDITPTFRKLPKDEYAAFLVDVAVKSSEKGTLFFANVDYDVADKVRDLLRDRPQYKVAKTTVKDISSGLIIKY